MNIYIQSIFSDFTKTNENYVFLSCFECISTENLIFLKICIKFSPANSGLDEVEFETRGRTSTSNHNGLSVLLLKGELHYHYPSKAR